MKIRHVLGSVFLAAAAAAGSANAVVVFSEDFESLISPQVVLDTVLPLGSFFAVSGSGTPNNFGNGWSLLGGVDFIRELAPGAHTFGAINSISVDLAGTPGPGQLSRTFDAVAGLTYVLGWQYFRNESGTNLDVTLGGTNASFGAPLNISNGLLTWTAASSGTQTLSFSGGAGFFGPTIDNVVLSAVPEPGPLALMFMGLGVVGFLARKRMRNS